MYNIRHPVTSPWFRFFNGEPPPSVPGASLGKGWTGLRDFFQLPMRAAQQAGPIQDSPNRSTARHPPSHILYIPSYIAEAERCLQALKKVQFAINAEIVVTPEKLTHRLSLHDYDLVIAEYPSSRSREANLLKLLEQLKRQTPLVIVGGSLRREMVARSITRGA